MVQPVHVQHVQQVQPVQPIQHVQHVQQQPVQYVVKESQYRPPPQPQFVQTRSTGGDVNYVAAAPGRPVSTLRDSKLFCFWSYYHRSNYTPSVIHVTTKIS